MKCKNAHIKYMQNLCADVLMTLLMQTVYQLWYMSVVVCISSGVYVSVVICISGMYGLYVSVVVSVSVVTW